MKHFNYETQKRKKEIFYKEPESFTKYADKDILAYALGAALYMPAMKESIAKDILHCKYEALMSLVIDLEDAVGDHQLEDAERMLTAHITAIHDAFRQQQLLVEDLPLIFIRVRNPEQMERITTQLGPKQHVLTGYVFPKFTCETGKQYLSILKKQNDAGHMLYGMPILESAEILYKETRMASLLAIKELLDDYRDLVLNVRVGVTDFCGLYGIRRNVDTTIYDVSLIRDCLTDILNIFNRQVGGYVVSGPVWEFFHKEERLLKPKLRMTPFSSRYGETGIEKRREILNAYIDGLINEVLLDKLNGIIGKTIIHPTHIKPVHALYTVSHEEYVDALSILANSEGQVGVLKSEYANKMNEMKPHLYWAKRMMLQAKVFGVYHEDADFTSLLMEDLEDEVRL